MAEHADKGESGARMVPLWQYTWMRAWSWLSWPYTVRQLKRAGFRRTGFMTWESGRPMTGARPATRRGWVSGCTARAARMNRRES